MVGRTILHYRITEKLGEGGIGVVYKPEDATFEHTVALKFLASHLHDDDEAQKQFRRDAKAAAALEHPNLCHVYQIAVARSRFSRRAGGGVVVAIYEQLAS